MKQIKKTLWLLISGNKGKLFTSLFWIIHLLIQVSRLWKSPYEKLIKVNFENIK